MEEFLNEKILKIYQKSIKKEDETIITVGTKNVATLHVNVYQIDLTKFLSEKKLEELSQLDTTGFVPNFV